MYKKIFISQPMNGRSDSTIKIERKETIERISAWRNIDKDFEIIDSYFEDAPHDAKPLWFLGKSFEKLSEADLAVFVGKWRNARGCKLEYDAAKAYGIPVVEVSGYPEDFE